MSARTTTGLLAATALIASAMTVGHAPPAAADHSVTPARVAGSDRYETAAQTARLQFPQGTPNAVVATGQAFPDALAGAALAGAADGPVLLVETGSVPAATAQALEDLGVENVYVLGGPQAVSAEVEQQLAAQYDVARLGGQSRFDTAAQIGREVDRLEGQLGTIAGLTTAFVASGDDFPDALAAGSLATTEADTFPILLVGQDEYPAATRQAIADLGIEQVVVLGGEAAVSPRVQNELEQDVQAVLRIAGADREQTALEVADFAMREFGYRGVLTVLARSDAFPDALAAGVHAGRNDAPILLTPPDRVGAAAHEWLHDQCPAVRTVRAVGGPDALTEQALADAQRHAEHCHAAEGQTDETYTVEPTRLDAPAPGTTVDMQVRERYDRRPLVGPLDVTLFPCDLVDRATGRFTDADGDGAADGLASTATGSATFTSAAEAASVEPRYVDDAEFLHGALSWSVRSGGEDCAVVVVFDDLDGDRRLSVDSQGHALEHYGAREVRWSAGG